MYFNWIISISYASRNDVIMSSCNSDDNIIISYGMYVAISIAIIKECWLILSNDMKDMCIRYREYIARYIPVLLLPIYYYY